jgi:hypothetical protein
MDGNDGNPVSDRHLSVPRTHDETIFDISGADLASVTATT